MGLLILDLYCKITKNHFAFCGFKIYRKLIYFVGEIQKFRNWQKTNWTIIQH